MSLKRVIIFDTDIYHINRIKEYLSKKNYSVLGVININEAFEIIKKQYFHLCIWQIDSKECVSNIYKLKQLRPQMTLIVSVSSNDLSLLISSVRAGAFNVWQKLNGIEQLLQILEEANSSDEEIDPEIEETPFPGFIGRHKKILEIFQLIHSIRNTESTVLISGESGTGKELVARAIHDLSPRNKRPWVAVNCGAIPASLLESELFGHVKGAFTGATQNRIGRFQVAANGTLFLDEIGDLPFDLQAKILRAIQHKVFEAVGSPYSIKLEARIIAATNQDLEKAVAEKRFREDLYYRLNVIPIHIPPLRSRKSDIPLLVRHFIDKFCKANNKCCYGITEEAMRLLVDYHWPGNIRELENLIERVVVLKRSSDPIEAKDLPVQHFRNVKLDRFIANVELPENGIDLNRAVDEFENELILQALQKTSGNKNKAAFLLNLNRTTLVEKLKRKNIKISL